MVYYFRGGGRGDFLTRFVPEPPDGVNVPGDEVCPGVVG